MGLDDTSGSRRREKVASNADNFRSFDGVRFGPFLPPVTAYADGAIGQKIVRFWCTSEHHFYKDPYSSLISRVVVAEGHPETVNARSKPRVSPGWPGHAAGEARIPRLPAVGGVNY